MVTSDPVHVLCIDDNADVRAVLKMLIDHTAGLSCVGALASSADLVHETESRHADVVLLDLHIPGCDPLESLQSLARSGSRAKVIVFTGDADVDTEERAVAAGAVACIRKGSHPDAILERIFEAARAA